MTSRHTKRTKRFRLAGAILILIGIGVGLVIYGLSQNVTFFYSPSDLKSTDMPVLAIRLGGIVKPGSIDKTGLEINDRQNNDDNRQINPRYRFIVTDHIHDVPVIFDGVPPDLFTQGESVIAYGNYDPGRGVFMADEILAKHDESYMPPEVADALQKAGQNPRQLTTTPNQVKQE